MEYGFIEYKDAETKTVVDNWYNNQLASKYNSYLADSIFCNDTKEESYRYIDTSGQYTDDAENAVDTHIYYAGNKRMTDKRPKLTCAQDKDKYTVDTANGNGLLTYPVGIITADEVLLASLGTNSYFYNGDNYFTMTPSDYLSWYSVRGTYYCSGAQLNDSSNSYVSSITHRPVINLKADVPFTGSGTITDPYIIGE